MKPRKRRLPLRTKTGYGVAEFGMSAAEVMLVFYLLEFYTEAVGLRADLAGFALALAMVWDAIFDPIMGGVSDRTRSRLGKRRPYIFLGSIVLSAGVLFIFSNPHLESQFAKFLYLLFSYMLTNTGMSIICVPHAALAGEITFDRNERTELFGWRLFFRTVGLMVAVILPGVLVISYEGREDISRTLSSRWVAISVLASALLTFFSVSKIDRPLSPFEKRPKSIRSLAVEVRGFFRGLYSVATNRVFLPLLVAYMLAFIARTINTSTALYYYQIRLQLTEWEISFNVLGFFAVVICLSVGVWVFISRRFGKKMPAFWGAFGLGLSTIVIYPILPPGKVLPPMLLGSVLGGFLVGSIIIFESLVADIVDYDELRTGEHREGLYFGCWTMCTKFARALALALTGIMLRVIGFAEGEATQSPETGLGLAILYGPVVGALFVLAALAFLFMPLTDDKHRRVQRLLEHRRARLRRKRVEEAQAEVAPEPAAPHF